jgi:hypothetical protein
MPGGYTGGEPALRGLERQNISVDSGVVPLGRGKWRDREAEIDDIGATGDSAKF